MECLGGNSGTRGPQVQTGLLMVLLTLHMMETEFLSLFSIVQFEAENVQSSFNSLHSVQMCLSNYCDHVHLFSSDFRVTTAEPKDFPGLNVSIQKF